MEQQIKILVVEDEMIIGAKIAMLLNELGYEVTGIVPQAQEALSLIESIPPDIALLDINLKGAMDGIELATILSNEQGIPVIFLTANTDDATFNRAKTAKPYAFLSKPFKKLDLQRALELTISLMVNKETSSSIPSEPTGIREDIPFVLSDRIFVRYKEKMVKIVFNTILFIEAERNYCRIITQTKEYLLAMPMKTLEDKLPANQFQRIHRSHIVNVLHVDEVSETYIMVGQKQLLLSKALRPAFLSRIKTV